MPKWIDFVRERLDAPDDVVEEIAHQLEDAFDEAVAGGANEEAARAEALRQVPDWRRLELSLDSTRRPRFGADFWQDVRYAARGLRSSPGFALMAIAALSLGIGANTVAFTFVQSMLFRPLPVRAPEELVRIYGSLPGSFEYATVSYPDYLEVSARKDLFSGALVDKLVPLNLGADVGNERIWAFMVSGGYFSVLGISPALGRFFMHEDEGVSGDQPVVVLGYELWQSAFGGRESVLGRTISLNGHPFTVIGVAPPGFHGTGIGLDGALWASTAMADVLMPGFDIEERANRSFLSMARLAPGVGLEEAQSALDILAQTLAREYPESNRGIGLRILPEAEGGIHPIMRGGFIGFSGVLVTVVALVLLLACANVAGLLLSRAATRRREIALRLSLGATRVRLVRQLLTESLLLSLVAGAVGVAVAWYAARFLRAFTPPVDLPLFVPMSLDARVLVFAVAVSVLTGVLFGLAPALSASRANLVPALKAASGSVGTHGSRLRSSLVVGQVALSTILLVGAGLFVRSLQNAHRVDLGFDSNGLVVASIDLSLQGYEEERGRLFFEELGDRLRVLPGVESVAWVNMLPFSVDINQHTVAPEGFEPSQDGGAPSINRNIVSDTYFATMGTTVVRGRGFDDRDAAEAPPVVIVNETLAEKFWPGENAVGKRMGRPGGTMMEVVGVVRDGKYLTLGEEPTPFFFYPWSQRPSLAMTFVVRVRRDPGALLEAIRSEVRSMDASLPVYDVETMEDHLKIALVPARAGIAILGSFGILALTLAAVGLYAILAFLVAHQTFEIGLRRALGATAVNILGSIVGRGLALASLGVALGLILSVGVSRLTTSLLYGIDPTDPAVYGLALLVLTATSIVASLVPARRALGIEPVIALRHD